MALKSLGYGVAPQGPQVVVNQPSQTVVVPVSVQDLELARAALRNSQRQMIDVTPQVIDGPTTTPEGSDASSPAGGEVVSVTSD